MGKLDQQLSAKILGPLIRARLDPAKQLLVHRVLVMILTFIVYTVYHASRRPLAIVKPTLHRNCTEFWIQSNINSTGLEPNSCNWVPFEGDNGRRLLGFLDTSFLVTYALGLFVSGYIAERSNLRYFLTIAMTLCSVMCLVFGVSRYLEIHVLYFYIIVQILSGIVQTTGWPAVVTVMGNWFGSTKNATIFGIWNWHTSIGNIIGAAVAGSFVDKDWGLSFIIPGLICFCTALLIFLFLIPKPKYVGLVLEQPLPTNTVLEPETKVETNGKCKNGLNGSELILEYKPIQEKPTTTTVVVPTGGDGTKHVEAISFWRALCIPGVVEFSMCLFFAKLVSYTFLDWLPLYLKETSGFSSSKSAFVSIFFDLGGCAGSLFAGLIADRSGFNALTCILFHFLAIPSFISGMCINAPYALITTAISASLGCKVPSKSAMATVSAIIDGTGSIGSALGPSIAGLISDWSLLFYLTMGANALAILCLLRTGYEEIKDYRKNGRKQ